MKKLLLLCISVCTFHTYAQEYPRKEINIRNFIQDIVGNPDGGVNEDLFESLYQNYLNPIDLNKRQATYCLSMSYNPFQILICGQFIN